MKTTLTIGVPVYNEEQNIGVLLKSIFKQEQLSYILEKILIINDGSTDKTPAIINSWQKKYPLIDLKVHTKRLGKAARLNELYNTNQSDYLFTLDGDVILGTKMEIEKVLKVARKTGADVTAAHQIPCKIHGFIERISYANHCLWTEVRIGINNGNYIQNLQGSATLIKAEFAKQINYPNDIPCDQKFLYIKASQKKAFAFSSKNEIVYRPLGTLRDWIKLNQRILSEDYYLRKLYGKKIPQLYSPSFDDKWRGISVCLKIDPLFTILAIGVNYAFKVTMPFQKPTVTSVWPVLSSTKAAIKRNIFLFSTGAICYISNKINYSQYNHLLQTIFRKTLLRI